MKPIKQVMNYGANFHGWTLPLYALYGNVNGQLYVCTRLTPRKDHYYNLRLWNGYRWTNSTTEHYPDIRRTMSRFMHSPDFIRTKTIPCEHRVRDFERTLATLAPKERRVPTPMYGTKQGCFSQSRVDGSNFNLELEERVRPKDLEYPGIETAKFEYKKPFDGLLDDVCKDHMKIKQTKCRPGKIYIVN